jgi:hypothetical protein
MWELICHHTYRAGGLPVDLSDHDQHGIPSAVSYEPDGAFPGSGALRFHAGGYVRIPASPVWGTLGGLAIEMTVRLEPPAPGRTNIRILADARPGFILLTYNHHVRFVYATSESSQRGERVGATNVVPYNAWTTVRLVHNGLDTVQFYVDDVLVSEAPARLAVPGVAGRDIWFGNANGWPLAMEGLLDDVKVWRLDPFRIRNVFVQRPLDRDTAACWEAALRSLIEQVASRPDCAELLRREMPRALDEMRRQIRVGDVARERYADICDSYAWLWRAGQINGPEMARLLRGWCGLLEDLGVDLSYGSKALAVARDCTEGLDLSALVECDRELAGFLELLRRECAEESGAEQA